MAEAEAVAEAVAENMRRGRGVGGMTRRLRTYLGDSEEAGADSGAGIWSAQEGGGLCLAYSEASEAEGADAIGAMAGT